MALGRGDRGLRAWAGAGLWFGSAILGLLILLTPASAHFQLNVNIRIIHIEHLDDGLRVYLRLPTPYVLAPLIGAPAADGTVADGTVAPAPYSSNRLEGDQLFHYLDPAALAADPLGLGALVAEGHHISHDGQPLVARVEVVRVYPVLKQPPFASLEEAKRAFSDPQIDFAGRDDLCRRQRHRCDVVLPHRRASLRH